MLIVEAGGSERAGRWPGSAETARLEQIQDIEVPDEFGPTVEAGAFPIAELRNRWVEFEDSKAVWEE